MFPIESWSSTDIPVHSLLPTDKRMEYDFYLMFCANEAQGKQRSAVRFILDEMCGKNYKYGTSLLSAGYRSI